MGPRSPFHHARQTPKTMELEPQVAHFRRLSTAVLCQRPEVRARTRAAGSQPPAPLLPPTPIGLTPVAPPSGRHFCETAQHDIHGDATATGRGERHPTVARIHPYPLGSSNVAYFTTVPRSCRAVPPDVSQVPKSALNEKIKIFKLSEMNLFERQTFRCALLTGFSPVIPHLKPPSRAPYPSRLLLPPVLARRRAATATSSRRPPIDEYMAQMVLLLDEELPGVMGEPAGCRNPRHNPILHPPAPLTMPPASPPPGARTALTCLSRRSSRVRTTRPLAISGGSIIISRSRCACTALDHWLIPRQWRTRSIARSCAWAPRRAAAGRRRMGGQGLSPCPDALCGPWRSGSSRGWVERAVATAGLGGRGSMRAHSSFGICVHVA